MQQRREERDGVEVAEVAASLDPLTELLRNATQVEGIGRRLSPGFIPISAVGSRVGAQLTDTHELRPDDLSFAELIDSP